MNTLLKTIVFAGLLLCWVGGCKQSALDGVELPPGTEVNGTLATGDVMNVVYWPTETGEPVVIPVVDDHTSFRYRSAVPPGDYTVYAYITGARAKITKVSVAETPVTVDIPEQLTWEEAKDEISGM